MAILTFVAANLAPPAAAHADPPGPPGVELNIYLKSVKINAGNPDDGWNGNTELMVTWFVFQGNDHLNLPLPAGQRHDGVVEASFKVALGNMQVWPDNAGKGKLLYTHRECQPATFESHFWIKENDELISQSTLKQIQELGNKLQELNKNVAKYVGTPQSPVSTLQEYLDMLGFINVNGNDDMGFHSTGAVTIRPVKDPVTGVYTDGSLTIDVPTIGLPKANLLKFQQAYDVTATITVEAIQFPWLDCGNQPPLDDGAPNQYPPPKPDPQPPAPPPPRNAPIPGAYEGCNDVFDAVDEILDDTPLVQVESGPPFPEPPLEITPTEFETIKAQTPAEVLSYSDAFLQYQASEHATVVRNHDAAEDRILQGRLETQVGQYQNASQAYRDACLLLMGPEPTIAGVPTLSEWGGIVLAAVLVLVGVALVRRR